jgi:hypothetical protein
MKFIKKLVCNSPRYYPACSHSKELVEFAEVCQKRKVVCLSEKQIKTLGKLKSFGKVEIVEPEPELADTCK